MSSNYSLMKKPIFILLSILIGLKIEAQDKFQLYKIQFPAIGIFSSTKSLPISTSGLSTEISLTGKYKSIYYVGEFGHGTGLLNFDADYTVNQYNILIGKDFPLLTWIHVETDIGIGLFVEKYKDGVTNFQYNRSSTIGFPLKAKFRFLIKGFPVFCFGPSVNINSLATIYYFTISSEFFLRKRK